MPGSPVPFNPGLPVSPVQYYGVISVSLFGFK